MVIKHAASRGPLAAGPGTHRATGIPWIFNDPALYDILVSRRGWSEPGCTAWLSNQIRHALLPSAPPHDLPMDRQRPAIVRSRGRTCGPFRSPPRVLLTR